MKNRGVFITILLILVLGAGITFQIRRFVTGNTDTSMALAGTAQASGAAVSAVTADTDAGMPEESVLSPAAADLVSAAEEAAVFGGKSRAVPEAVAEGGINPEEQNTIYVKLTAPDYQKRLEEVDRLVTEKRESDVSSNTDSMKNNTEYEYRLWDAELNQLYQSLLSAMTEEAAEKLREEERQWIRNRDQLASQAAAKFKGGTMESLEYTASMASSTRERVYELLEQYGFLLPQQ